MKITATQTLLFDVENYNWYGDTNHSRIIVDAEELRSFREVAVNITRGDAEFFYRIDNPLGLPILNLLSLVSLDDHCTYSDYDQYDVTERKMVQAVVEEAIRYMTKVEGYV